MGICIYSIFSFEFPVVNEISQAVSIFRHTGAYIRLELTKPYYQCESQFKFEFKRLNITEI